MIEHKEPPESMGPQSAPDDAQAEKLITPVAKKMKVHLKSECHDASDVLKCDQSAMNCLQLAMKETERQTHSIETKIREKRMLECALVEERRLRNSLSTEKGNLQEELDGALIAIQAGKTEFDTKMESWMAIALAEKQNVREELYLVEGERDANSRALAEQIDRVIKCDTELAVAVKANETMERRMVSVERERDAALIALAQETAEGVKGCEEKLRMVTAIECSNRELQYEVDLMREEAAACKRKTTTDMDEVKMRLGCLTEQKDRLDTAHEKIKRTLEEEAERNLCQICIETPKDTISFPCLHLRCCSSCLEKWRRLSNTCPSCRSFISGVLRLNRL